MSSTTLRSSAIPMILVLLMSLFAPRFSAQAQQGDSPWGEIVDESGNIRFDNLTDLGETSEPAEWMDIELPLGLEIDLDANH